MKIQSITSTNVSNVEATQSGQNHEKISIFILPSYYDDMM